MISSQDRQLHYKAIEALGRTRLSKNFFFRDFLYSDAATIYGISNFPDNPDLAMETGRHLCEKVLEPLQDYFGRIHISSGYRSSALNSFCNEHGLGCASNENNHARHIWDRLDKNGFKGAMAFIIIPSYLEEYRRTGDFRPLAQAVKKRVEFDEMIFHPRHCGFNIGWHEKPSKSIYSYIRPCLGRIE